MVIQSRRRESRMVKPTRSLVRCSFMKASSRAWRPFERSIYVKATVCIRSVQVLRNKKTVTCPSYNVGLEIPHIKGGSGRRRYSARAEPKTPGALPPLQPFWGLRKETKMSQKPHGTTPRSCGIDFVFTQHRTQRHRKPHREDRIRRNRPKAARAAQTRSS